MQENIETLVPELPMTEEYGLFTQHFYVRQCYDAYYQMIISLLEGRALECNFTGPQNNYVTVKELDEPLEFRYRFVTVTGTPGIGKSMFYQYFFKRNRNENPSKQIVTASFDKDRHLEECRVLDETGFF